MYWDLHQSNDNKDNKKIVSEKFIYNKNNISLDWFGFIEFAYHNFDILINHYRIWLVYFKYNMVKLKIGNKFIYLLQTQVNWVYLNWWISQILTPQVN